MIAAVALLLTGTAFQANAQTEIAVSGQVKDVYGNPLPGVIVSIGSEDVYVTDKDGNYAITAKNTKNLTFSLLGYKQLTTKVVSGLDVVLEDDAHGLAENINLGQSKSYREVLTDAVSTVSGETLGKSLMSRFQNTFSGQLSGLTTIENSFEPAYESLSMYIRGLSTHHGGAASVVIDGILYDSYVHDILYRITPEEVESVTVLKDGAAQAIYGANGANGVIVINTKRGTPGKLKIGVNVSETLEQPTTVIQAFDSWKYATLRNQAACSDGLGSNVYFNDEAIDAMKQGDDPLYPNTRWADLLLRPVSQMQRASLDVTGGNSVVKYYSNLNLLRQGGFWNVDDNDDGYNANNEKYRVNFRSNIDINVNSWISLYMNLAGSVVRARTPGGGVANNGSIYNLMTYMPSTLYGPVTPEILDVEGNVTMEAGEVTVTEKVTSSPYGNLNRVGYSIQTNTNIYGQGGIKLKLDFITPGLWLGGSVGYLSYITATQGTTKNYARYVRDDDWSQLLFTQYGTTINSDLAYSKSQALYGYMSYKGETGWQRDFGRHHVAANAYATYQVFDDITGNITPTYDFRRIFSGAELKYDFDRRYAVKLSTGYSASDYYPRKTRFIWTPGASTAWVVSNEHFIKENLPWLSLLKFRGSYAITGNDSTGYDRYAYRDQVGLSNGGVIPYLLYTVNESVYGNAYLTPEKVAKWNLGVDLGLANQFTVSFDIFKEHMTNGLARSTALVPVYQGISLGSYPVTNLAEFENRGWEVCIGYNHRFNSNWRLFMNGHLDYNKNKVIYVGESANDDTYAYPLRSEGFPYGQSWGYLADWSNGNGLYNFQDEIEAGPTYSFGTPRLGDIKYQDLNNDGVIDEKDQAPIGNGALPRYSFGLTAGFQYRNFEASILFQGVADYYRNYLDIYTLQTIGEGIYTDTALGAWTAEKWLNDEPITSPALSTQATTNSQTNDFFLRNASFLRVKNLELSYKFPRKACDFFGASQFKLYVGGQNLFTFDKLGKDMFVEGGTFSMPIYRMYRVGVNVTF